MPTSSFKATVIAHKEAFIVAACLLVALIAFLGRDALYNQYHVLRCDMMRPGIDTEQIQHRFGMETQPFTDQQGYHWTKFKLCRDCKKTGQYMLDIDNKVIALRCGKSLAWSRDPNLKN